MRSFGLATVALDRLFYKATTPADAGLGDQAAALGEDTGLGVYAAEQAVLPALILEALAPQWGETPGAREVYEQVEAPLLPVLAAMEEEGIELDSGVLTDMSRRLELDAGDLAEEIFDLAGERFNIQSPPQLGVILFEKLGYPVLGRTRKTKKYSTGAEVLEQLAQRGFDLPAKVLQYRELTKLKSTYVDALPHLVAADGRLHTRYHQAVAATGRLSSHDPNLQNIPIRTDIGRQVRRAFRARDGYLLLVADYSQIELRVLAHISGDETLTSAFQRGDDIHRSTAATVFGVAPELVTDEQRRASKTINFGIIYGMSAFGLARAPRDCARRGPELHRRLLRALPRRAHLHRADAGAGGGGTPRRDPLRPRPLPAGHQEPQPRGAREHAPDGRQRSHPGHGRGSLEAGHDRRRPPPAGGTGSRAAPPDRPRRTRARSASRRDRGSFGGGQGRNGGSRRPERAPGRGRRNRPRLVRREGLRRLPALERRDDLVAVGGERAFLVVVHQVDGKVVDPQGLQLPQLRDMVLGGSEHAQPVDDAVGYELGVRVAAAAVVRVVVSLTLADVLGELSGPPSSRLRRSA